MNIACVVVTYNRKHLLKRCVEAVAKQSFKPTCVYILDNASTDGTMDAVKEWGFYNTENDGIKYSYILNAKNEGGAGGFYHGMKYAMEDGDFDALWVMDDDGEPDKDCLKNLVAHLGAHDYIAPIVLSDEDRYTCSFVPDTDYEEFCKRADKDGVVKDWASPFNGILYSAKLIRKIGYPKKEMFIWGDEINYHLRAKNAGSLPATIVNAIHYHPLSRGEVLCNEQTLGVHLFLVKDEWKLYCAIRNRVYNLNLIYNRYVAFKKARELYKGYIHYYHSTGDKSKDKLLFDAVVSGYLGYFAGLKKYLSK